MRETTTSINQNSLFLARQEDALLDGEHEKVFVSMFAIRIMDQAGALARRHEIPRTFPRVALCLSEPQTPRPDQLCGYLWVQALKTAGRMLEYNIRIRK